MCIVFNLNVIRQNTYQDLYSLAKNPFSYFSPPLIIKIVNICSDTGHFYYNIISIIKRSFHFHFSLRYNPQVQSSSCHNKCLHYEKTRGNYSCILAEELCFPGHSTRELMNKKRPIICENSQKFSVG